MVITDYMKCLRASDKYSVAFVELCRRYGRKEFTWIDVKDVLPSKNAILIYRGNGWVIRTHMADGAKGKPAKYRINTGALDRAYERFDLPEYQYEGDICRW